MSNPYISLCKIPSHNLDSVYSNFLTNEIDLCFPKLYSSQLIRTQIVIWKSASRQVWTGARIH